MLTLVLLGAALVLFAVGYVVSRRAHSQASQTREFLQGSVGTRAEVVEVREKYRPRAQSDDMPTYFPVVAFALPDGRRVETEVLVGARPSPARVGSLVDVRYDPRDPTRVMLARGMASGGALGCFATAFGAFFWVFGGLLVLLWVLLKVVMKVPA